MREELELVIAREPAGRLLELDNQGRPAFLRATQVQGKRKQRFVVHEVSPSAPTGDPHGWLELASAREFVAAFDVVKIYSARGARVIPARRARLDRAYEARFRRLLDTYGWGDPVPHLTVCVVGLGRLGSKVVQALAEQGIRSFVLIDPQPVEDANRQLTVYGRVRPGVAKVVAIQDFLGPEREVVPIRKALWDLEEVEWTLFSDADVLFLCVDNALARMLACRKAMTAGIPVFEGGVSVEVPPGGPPRLLGRVQTALPGSWCLSCLPGAFDRETASQELAQVERLARLRAGPQAADPTLSEWIASSMVLLFRMSLRGGGIWPRYLFQLGNGVEETVLARRETVVALPQCDFCRPAPTTTAEAPPPNEDKVPEATPVSHAPPHRKRWASRLVGPLFQALERVTVWTGTMIAAFCGGLASLGLALGLLMAIRHMIGFEGPYGELPNPWHFIWHFGSWRYDHRAIHYLGLITSAAIMIALPYFLFGLPLLAARWGHRTAAGPFFGRRARRGLRQVFHGLEELRERWPRVPELRVPQSLQRYLVRAAQGLGVGTALVALLLLFPVARALGWFWLVSLAAGLPIFAVVGIARGTVRHLRGVASVVNRLTSQPRTGRPTEDR